MVWYRSDYRRQDLLVTEGVHKQSTDFRLHLHNNNPTQGHFPIKEKVLQLNTRQRSG
jgi:hypothetical protein